MPNRSFASAVTVLLCLILAALPARGEVKIVVEHIDNAHATADPKFKMVPPPSKADAASAAKLTLISGTPDRNTGDLEKLTDGKFPREEDEPDQSFFFTEGADGGRLLLDLGSPIAVSHVNVYSWHPNTRGP